MTVRIHALQTGRVRIHRKQAEPTARGPLRIAATMADREWTDWLPCFSWAIEHPEGTIVVDAGVEPGHVAADWDVFERLSTRWDVEPEDALTARVAEAGLDAGAVRLHVVTHLHVDHVGGVGTLPGAEVVVGADEWRAAARPDGTLKGYRFPPNGPEPRTLTFDGPPLDGFAASALLTQDGVVVALPTRGHTAGHLSVLVDDGGPVRHLVTGDAVYSEAQLLRGGIDGVSQFERDAHATVGRLQGLCRARPTVVLPTHDPQAAARLAAAQTTTL